MWMTRKAQRGWIGLALVLLTFVYPMALWIEAPSDAESEPVHVPLRSAVTLPAPLKQGHWYIFQITAKTGAAAKNSGAVPRSVGAETDGNTQDGAVGCMLQAPDPNSEPAPYKEGGPCAKVPGLLRFHYRLLDAAGQVVRGDYGVPFEGDYGDRDRYFDVGMGDSQFAAEFASLNAQSTGIYRLEISRLRIPSALEGAAPQLEVYAHVSSFGFMEVLPGLLLSALLFLAGVIVLLVAAFTRRQH